MENHQDNGNAEQAAPQGLPVEDEDGCVTIGDIVKDLDDMEKAAEVLFGCQDPSVCTYPEGYKPRQTVFTCLTCTPEPQMAGVCYGCSLNCHEGHNIVELYTKRKFQCDCGNSKFGTMKCSLYEEKSAENKYNIYNHNYNGKFCSCDVFFPEDEEDHEFFQCEICEDWYHENHIQPRSIKFEEQPTAEEGSSSSATATTREEDASIICQSCVTKLPFLLQMPSGKEVFCHSKIPKSDTVIEPVDLEIAKFRKRLCKCADCVRVYETAECEFLLDDEDDIGTYEKESKKKAAENRITPEEEMRNLVRTYGMDGTQKLYEGVNNLKRKLGEFMQTKDNGTPVTADEVKTFFARLNEESREKRARRD